MSVADILHNDKKKIAWLCDPDKTYGDALLYAGNTAQKAGVDLILIGGSLVQENHLDECITTLRSVTEIPIVLFPGNGMQFSEKADAMLFLSLLSGRNPDLLIGQHVNIAYRLHKSNMEVIPTGYILIDGGEPTSVSYMSNTFPIPRDKTNIAVSTALAGKLLGMQAIYLEAGSGAPLCVPNRTIKATKETTNIPLFVGGGIRNAKTASMMFHLGANVVVIGTAVEENPDCLFDIVSSVQNKI